MNFENNFDLSGRADKKIQEIKKAIAYLEDTLSAEVAKNSAKLQYGMEHGKAIFEKEILHRHKELKISSWKYLTSARLLVILSALIIYPMIIPILLLDITVTIYQHICFRIYHIPLVKRGDYMIFERTHLAYLNIIQKVNCAYCSYGNGVIAYTREIFSLTEQYWCPIKHAKKMVTGYHDRYEDFSEFGDADTFVKKYMTHKNTKDVEY